MPFRNDVRGGGYVFSAVRIKGKSAPRFVANLADRWNGADCS